MNTFTTGRLGRGQRILILDSELQTLAFVEQVLQDSGLAAVTTMSVIEATCLLSTGFFDVFIYIDRPKQVKAAGKPGLWVAARANCPLSLCWNGDNIRQQCNDFVESAIDTKPLGQQGVRTYPRALSQTGSLASQEAADSQLKGRAE